ncbi:hypothetical protein [Bartonella sp. B41]
MIYFLLRKVLLIIAIISQTTAFMLCLDVGSACASEVEDEFLPYDTITRAELEKYDKAYREYVKREYAPGEHAKKLKIAREYIRDYSISGFYWVFDEPRDRHLVFTVCKALRNLLDPNYMEHLDKVIKNFWGLNEFQLKPDDVARVLRRDLGWSDFHFRWLDDAVLKKDLDIMQSLQGDNLGTIELAKARVFVRASEDARYWLKIPKVYRKYPALCLAMKEVQHIMMPERKKDIRYKIRRFFDKLRSG